MTTSRHSIQERLEAVRQRMYAPTDVRRIELPGSVGPLWNQQQHFWGLVEKIPRRGASFRSGKRHTFVRVKTR